MTFVVPGSVVGSVDEQFPGMRVPLLGYLVGTSGGLVASQAYVRRFVAYKTVKISKIQFGVTVAAGSNDNCDVGIFSGDWQTLLASAGSTPGKLNAAGIQTVNLLAAVTLQAGVVYYTAFACGPIGTTAASLAMAQLDLPSGTDAFGATAGLREHSFQGAFPLAAPHVSGGQIANSPILMLLT